jgi:tRNA-splicing ligase RtcB
VGGVVNIFGEHDDATLGQLRSVSERAERVALMADGHLGYVMPIGGVAAYRNQVSVVGVGFDIACGNAAILTDVRLADVGADDAARRAALTNQIQRTISFGMGRSNRNDDAPADHPLFEDAAWDGVPRQDRVRLRDKARAQLGTVGGGNHYVDVFADEQERLWVGVHFGSRGFGHTVASGFLALGQGARWGQRVPEREVLLDVGETGLGHDYWHLMSLAGQYAYAGREWVARKVVSMLGARELDLVHNHHNFAWKETHGRAEFVVIRKGATPAFPGQRGFIGGSMGDDAVIVEGARTGLRAGASDGTRDGTRGDMRELARSLPQSGAEWDSRKFEAIAERQRAALYSTVHGAGRVMSRTAAIGKRNRRTGEVIAPGRVSHEMMREWVTRKGVILRGGGLDESPHVYRRLPDVLAAQHDTVTVLHTLRPLIVVMAKPDEFDPYRD